MKISKLIAAAAVTAVTMTAAAAAANAATTKVSDPDTGMTTVTIDFADMASAYSEYLNNDSADTDNGTKGSLLKKTGTYMGHIYGELPGYYGFYPNLATGNTKDYIVSGKLAIGSNRASNVDSINVNGEKLSYGRYLKFVPEYDCDLTVNGSASNKWCVGSASGSGTISNVTISCTKGEEYYIYSNSNGKALTITSLSYTYDTPPVVPSAEVTSLTKLNDETLTDEDGGQADAYTFTVTGKNGEFTAKSVSFDIESKTYKNDTSFTVGENSDVVFGLIVNSEDSSKVLPKVTQDMITIE